MLPGEYPDYSVPTRIHRFVTDSFYHDRPLSIDYSWSLTTTLFFNSTGTSLCGDAADLVVHLATRHGFAARRWGLQGHIVAEVFDGGKWKMYDADYGIYFVNRSGEIASVEELQNDPDLIVNPLYPMEWVPPWNPYTVPYSQLFATPDNRVISSDPTGLPAEPLVLALPPRARVVFPGRYAGQPATYNGTPLTYYQNLKLVLPPGFTGPVDVFLILHEIRGRGSVSFDGETFEIGSPELAAAIASNRGPAIPLEVMAALTPVEIVYFLSPLRFFLLPATVLVLEAPAGQLVEVVQVGDPAADSDADGVLDDGGGDTAAADQPCADGQPLACDDNCTFWPNPDQRDTDADGAGNACDADVDDSGFVDGVDRAIVEACAAAGAPGPPADPTCAESDLDGDGSVGAGDLARLQSLFWMPPRPGEQGVGAALPQAPGGCGAGFAAALVPPLLTSLRRRGRRPRRASLPSRPAPSRP